MAYEHRRIGRQRLLYDDTNDDNPLRYQLIVDGAKVVPTSATIAIYKPGATSATVAAAAMTVTGTVMTKAITTVTTADFPVSSGYRADIVVTYDSKTYGRHIVFDVAKYYFDLNISFDQVVAMDGEVRGAHNDGDEDFGNLIDAIADEIQSDIETKIIKGDTLLQHMILDNSRITVAARRKILSQIYENRDNEDKRDWNDKQYHRFLSSALGSMKFDTDQDGYEDATVGGITPIVLHM